jgi:hypothetical protein
LEEKSPKFRGSKITGIKDRSRTLALVYTYILSLPRPEEVEGAEIEAGGSEAEEMVVNAIEGGESND